MRIGHVEKTNKQPFDTHRFGDPTSTAHTCWCVKWYYFKLIIVEIWSSLLFLFNSKVSTVLSSHSNLHSHPVYQKSHLSLFFQHWNYHIGNTINQVQRKIPNF